MLFLGKLREGLVQSRVGTNPLGVVSDELRQLKSVLLRLDRVQVTLSCDHAVTSQKEILLVHLGC